MQTTHLITYEESLQMPENKLEEILDGESRIMPPPTTGNHLFLRKLSSELERVFPGYDVCRDPCGLGTSREPLRYPIPDVSVYPEGAIVPGESYIWTPPILIVEVLSPSNRRGNVADLLADYESIGVPEVWFFYPEQHVFQKYVLENGKLHLKEKAAPGSISLDELWRAFHGN